MKDFSSLKKATLEDPASKQAYVRKKRELLDAVRLAELRRARQITQEELAKSMRTTQSSISRIEKQTDLYITTLRSYVEAVGGTLEISAVFPDGSVAIEGFGSLQEQSGQAERNPRRTDA